MNHTSYLGTYNDKESMTFLCYGLGVKEQGISGFSFLTQVLIRGQRDLIHVLDSMGYYSTPNPDLRFVFVSHV